MRLLKGIFLILAGWTMLASATEPLRISAIPDEAPTELIRKFAPLVEYLSKEIGQEVVFLPLVNYAATVEALAAGKIDLVWYGGFTHVQARRRTGGNALPLVMRLRDLSFRSKFITRRDSGIKALEDLSGKTFAFGSVSSTSGHLMPRYFLKQAGLDPRRDFKRFSFSGAHDATAKWVEVGKVDAGVLNEAVLNKLITEGKVDPEKIDVFHTTPGYVDYNWTARANLDRRTLSAITLAFLRLDPKNAADREILNLQQAERYVLAFPGDFDAIEIAARESGLLED